MYYRVLSDSLRYVDQGGEKRRASKGTIVYLEQRSEVKRLLAGKEIERVSEEEVAMDRNLTLRLETTPEEQEEAKKKEERKDEPKSTSESDDDGDEQDESSTPQAGDLVEGKVDGRTLIGEVVSILKNGKLKVRFSDDTKKHRQMTPEEVEVIG